MRIPTGPIIDSTQAEKPSCENCVSFSRDILPLFRPTDIQNMNSFGVRLGEHGWMSKPSNAKNVLNHLRGTTPPQMPLGGPYWTEEQLLTFERWMAAGYPP